MPKHSPVSRRRFLGNVSCAAAGLAIPACLFDSARIAFADDEPLDLVFVGGTVVDGSGQAPFASDVGIRAGKIVAVAQLSEKPAQRRVSGTGLVVAPGFIDMHTHSDRTLVRDGTAQSAVRQGVTTHVIGNCGSSPAPANQAASGPDGTFRTFADFLSALTGGGVSINVAALVGHNQVRATAMGYDRRRPTESEMTQMKDLVDEAMRAGAIGMSTGLVSPPGAYSETAEIIELAKVVTRHHGIYASHIRGEAGTLIDSVQEAIAIGREAGVPVEISHHKAAGRENWGRTRLTLAMIEEANRKGQRVRVDVYPYHAGSAGLSQLVPPWAHEGGTEKLLERLRDPESRRRISREMSEGAPDWPNYFTIDWNDIQIAYVTSDANRRWVGHRIEEVAQARRCKGVEACIDLLIEENAKIGMINFVMDGEEVKQVLKHPLSTIGSDGSAMSRDWAEGKPHPRSYGCFPRVLGRYVRGAKLLSLEAAVHKMTGMPAAQLGLADRGLIKVGQAADLVLFDPTTINDTATFEDPHRYPLGIMAVAVNGKLVLAEGEHTGRRPGTILSPQA